MEPAIGDSFLGSIVRNVGREFHEPKNGKVRVRQYIELENGMNLVEDVFKDFKEIEEIQQNNKKGHAKNSGEYKEAELIEIAPPKIIATPPIKPKKAKKKSNSIDKQTKKKERELSQASKE